MSKRVLILQSNYIPWKGYFDCIHTCDEFVVYDDMQYTKGDWRNRNKIKTPQGLRWLTIPVTIRGKLGQSIRDTKVANRDWPAAHWRQIQEFYSEAPFFAETRDFLEDLYDQAAQLDYLSEVNLLFLNAICGYLGIGTTFHSSAEFDLVEDRTQRLIDICQKLGGTDYYSGPAARAYMDESYFQDNGIALHWFDYSGYPEYEQVHPPFEHQVSILDLVLCTGPDATSCMTSFDSA